ncbi:MAG: prephenate dehydratase [Ignavibacteria bacterium]|nr:prephenate dehydratase [Ignavibacteria bacterium]
MAILSVGYQGERGAYSEQAARLFFRGKARLVPYAQFSEVFRHASKGGAHFSVIPIENSLFGSVHENYDHLIRSKLSIVGEIKLKIQHQLMASRGTTLKEIRTVYSHPQALGQCQEFLRSLKRVETRAFYDTAGAAKMLARENLRDAAAIASEQAAKTYGLKILKRNIEDNHHNFTRFLVLSTRPIKPKLHPKTSLVFSVRDVPGALFKALAVFALRDINLHKIESRPLVGRPWEYLFYLDISGCPGDPIVRQAVSHLREFCTFLRILGSYEAGKTR